ncbi:MAG: zf-HC2 domain-containing protein [Pseudomonadales bacterium]
MNCPSLLVQSLYNDGELDKEQATAFVAHLSQCDSCKAMQHQLLLESEALKTALHMEVEELAVPQLQTGPSVRHVFLSIMLVVASGVLIDTAWQKLGLIATLPGWLSWLAPNLTDAAFSLLDFLTDVLRNVFDNEGLSLQMVLWWLLPTGLLFAFTYREPARNTRLAGIVFCLALSIGYAPESAALDVRHDDDSVTISANEVIDDTLIVAADEVIIEGDVSGDLIAVGEKVTIRSKIGGNVIAFAEELVFETAINGTVFAAGKSVTIKETGITGNLFIAGEKIRNDYPFIVGGNILLAAKDAELGAQIGRELWATASAFSFSGKIAKDLRYYGGELELSGKAHVAGNLQAMVADEASLSLDDNAVILGERSIEFIPEEASSHSASDYYFGRLLKLLAAFLFGLVMFALFPSLRFASALDGRELLGSSALGAVALITTPILAVLIMITLVGLPIGITALLLWIIAMYAAPIVAGAYVGDAILANTEQHRPIMALFLGLLILFVLASIPFVGFAVRLIALIVGLGIIVRWVRDIWDARDYGEN